MSSYGVSPSVLLFFTLMYCVKMSSHIGSSDFPPLGRHIILVFPYQTLWQYTDCSCYVVHGTWYGVRDTHNFWGAPVAQPAPTKFGTKVAIVTYSPNRSCVPNLKLLASTVAEVGGPKFFQCSLAQTPVSFCPKSCFLVRYCASPNCTANLNLLASWM